MSLWKAKTPLSGVSSDNRKEVFTIKEIKVNPENKDRVFRLIFGGTEKSWMLSLYNAVNGSDYKNPDDITVTTLDDVIYYNMKNDVSFLIADTMNFVEHQSTINPNMPLRMLMYAGRVYSEYVHSRSMDINRGTLQRIPAPRLVVFYNGERFTEDAVTLKLSDAFMNGQRGDLEAKVTMLNINYGRNKELMGRCRPLSDYSLFVSTVRKCLSEGKTMKEAVHLAIGKLADDSPIKKHLTDMEAQVVFNCLTEFNAELHDKSMRDDGRNEGLEKGREEQARYTNTQMRSAGMTVDQRSKMLGLPADILSSWDNESTGN